MLDKNRGVIVIASRKIKITLKSLISSKLLIIFKILSHLSPASNLMKIFRKSRNKLLLIPSIMLNLSSSLWTLTMTVLTNFKIRINSPTPGKYSSKINNQINLPRRVWLIPKILTSFLTINLMLKTNKLT